MKNKMHRILGIGVTIALLSSLLTVAAPVSAGTLSWSAETLLSSDVTINQLLYGSDVDDIAVATGGSIIYVVDDDDDRILKSTDGGANWVRLNLPAALDDPALIAVAPGDANIILVYDDDDEDLFLSNDGGITFSLLAPYTLDPMTTINAIAISPLTAGQRYVTIAGQNSLGDADVQYLNMGALVSNWVSIDNDTGWTTNGYLTGSTEVLGIAFSPNFASDKIMTLVTTDGSDTFFEIASFSSKKLNNVLFVGSSYPVTILSTAAWRARISLDPTYLGADETLRVAWVATSDGLDTGKLQRLTDTTVKDVKTALDFWSVAYNGTHLVAGAEDSNNVWYSANPTASTPTLTNTSLYQRPSGNGDAYETLVAWAGSNVVAGTSGDTSAFSVSKDNGVTFNDISLIDGNDSDILENLRDVAISKDGNTIFLVSDDGSYTSVWRKASGVWERVLVIDGTSTYILRMAPDNNAVLYLNDTSNPDLFYTDDSGEKKWQPRGGLISTAVDVAVESAQVLYALTASGKVSKSSNAGFTFDAEVSTGVTGGGATIVSVAKDQLLVGSTDGSVAWSTDGNASSTTWRKFTGGTGSVDPKPFSSGNVQLTADKLSTGGYVYAATSTATQDVRRFLIGTSTSWSDIITGSLTGGATGIALNDGVLYVLTHDGASSYLFRTLIPTTAGSSNPAGYWTSKSTTDDLVRTPQALKVAAGKFYAIHDASPDKLDSFTDTTYKTAPTLKSPADQAVPQTNPVNGNPQDIPFTWDRLGSTVSANKYELEIALDTAFTQLVIQYSESTTDNPVVVIIGPTGIDDVYNFAPGTTYYWRVRAVEPLQSPWSVTRNFAFSSLDTPFGIAEPRVGAAGLPIDLILTWTAYKGALWYEVTVSEDPSFAIPEFSHNVNNLFYAVEEDLKYGTTYYWRVRGVTAEPYVKGKSVITPSGPWVTGAFTTMAEPVKEEPAVITIEKQAPPQIIQLPPVERVVVQEQPIPSWMLMTIIIIGAVLVIALIVLIVRTRRVA